MIDELEWIWKEANFRGGTGENHENIQDGWCAGRDSDSAPLEY
jgi:hypothetical protein